MGGLTPAGLREVEGLRAMLVDTHPTFRRLDEILMELAADVEVSPQLYERICEAVFIPLMAYAERIYG